MIKTGEAAFKNFLYLSFANAILKIGSLITVIYTANILGPDNFGKLNFASTFLTYFAAIADFAFSTIAVREIAQNRKNTYEIINSTITGKILFSILSFFRLPSSHYLSVKILSQKH